MLDDGCGFARTWPVRTTVGGGWAVAEAAIVRLMPKELLSLLSLLLLLLLL